MRCGTICIYYSCMKMLRKTCRILTWFFAARCFLSNVAIAVPESMSVLYSFVYIIHICIYAWALESNINMFVYYDKGVDNNKFRKCKHKTKRIYISHLETRENGTL